MIRRFIALAMFMMPLLAFGLHAQPVVQSPGVQHPRPEIRRPAWLSLHDRSRAVVDPDSTTADAEWYSREITVPAHWRNPWLVFAAWPHRTAVWLDGECVPRRFGDSSAVEVQLTPCGRPGIRQKLIVRIEGRRPGGWFRLWETVYLEDRGTIPMTSITLNRRLDGTAVVATVRLPEPAPGELSLRVTIDNLQSAPTAYARIMPGDTIGETGFSPLGGGTTSRWSPHDAFEYQVTATLSARNALPGRTTPFVADTIRTRFRLDSAIIARGRNDPVSTTQLTDATCPVCTVAQRAAWLATHDSTLRVQPRDVPGHRIGMVPARGYTGVARFQPLLPEKQVACGQMESFQVATNDMGKWDWKIRARPTAVSRPLHDAARDAAPEDDVKRWPCNGDCFMSEVTPDNGFRDSYFMADVPAIAVNDNGVRIPVEPAERIELSAILYGDTLCSYGPWVQDLEASGRASIHPAEVVWFRHRRFGVVYAMIVQDDSDRFDRASNFLLEGRGDWMRPWSAVPRWTDLRVAFAAPIGAPNPAMMDVDGDQAHRVMTRFNTQATADGDSATVHVLRFNGNVVMAVRERETPSDRIGVSYVDMCRTVIGGRDVVIGYVSLQTVIGDTDRGEGPSARDEGFYVIRITPGERDAEDVLSVPDPALVPREFNYHFPLPRLGADSGSAGRRSIGRGSAVRMGGGLPALAMPATIRLNAPPLARMPMTRGGTVSIGEHRDRIDGHIPRHELGGSIILDSAEAIIPERDSVALIAWVTDALLDSSAMAPFLMQVRRRVIEALPIYVALPDSVVVDSMVGADRESPLAEILNAAIHSAARGDDGLVRRIFETPQPFRTSWTWTARNLFNGNAVPVVMRDSTVPGAISVRVSNGAFTGSRVTVRMPAGGFYELTGTARFTDIDGVTGAMSYRMHSHELAARDPARLLDILLSAVDSVAARNDLASREDAPRRSARRAREAVARGVAHRIAADGIVSIKELEDLQRALGLNGSPLR